MFDKPDVSRSSAKRRHSRGDSPRWPRAATTKAATGQASKAAGRMNHSKIPRSGSNAVKAAAVRVRSARTMRARVSPPPRGSGAQPACPLPVQLGPPPACHPGADSNTHVTVASWSRYGFRGAGVYNTTPSTPDGITGGHYDAAIVCAGKAGAVAGPGAFCSPTIGVGCAIQAAVAVGVGSSLNDLSPFTQAPQLQGLSSLRLRGRVAGKNRRWFQAMATWARSWLVSGRRPSQQAFVATSCMELVAAGDDS